MCCVAGCWVAACYALQYPLSAMCCLGLRGVTCAVSFPVSRSRQTSGATVSLPLLPTDYLVLVDEGDRLFCMPGAPVDPACPPPTPVHAHPTTPRTGAGFMHTHPRLVDSTRTA